MNNDPRGTIIQQGNIMRIDNALVEDVFCYDNRIGNILVSYAVPEADQSISVQNLRFILFAHDQKHSATGKCFSDSCQKTASIPPQTTAFRIQVI